jgi:hypothetical protein
MDSSPPAAPTPRSAHQLIDSADLRAAIAQALDAVPIHDETLRHAVWTFVDTERHAGTSPGEVIVALKDLMSQAQVASLPQQHAAVILWCVEAYFGHLGGDLHGWRPVTSSDPRPASRR